jgi:hypothetical protein
MKNFFLAMMIVMMSAGLAMAQETIPTEQATPTQKAVQAPDAPEVYTTESVSGEVSAIGKRYISVVYNTDYDTGTEYEVMIPITENTVYSHTKGLSDIKRGDLVSIQYKKPAEGSKGTASAETISFIQAAVAGAGLVSKGTDISGATDSAVPQGT